LPAQGETSSAIVAVRSSAFRRPPPKLRKLRYRAVTVEG
jgi:hypothetical protein